MNRRAQEQLEASGSCVVGEAAPPLKDSGGRSVASLSLDDGTRVFLLPESTDAVSLREQVYHLSRLASVGRLVTTVVHEINNALSGIVGYSQLLLERELGSEERTDLERIHEEALRTSRVAQHLLRFGRGGVETTGRIELADLLQRCRELKRRDLALKSIDLRLEVSPGLPEIHGSESLIFQVFVNLITNAEESIHACQPRGRITISARRAPEHVVVQVRDDGPGVPRDQAERIFDPFYTTRAAGKGTGLGLAICRDILAEHGADIQLARTRSRGASFRVRFPLPVAAAISEASQKPATRAVAPIRNRHIVIIEDEPSVREVVTRAFTGNGNSVASFERGEDALEYLEGRSVDLLVSDVHRPGLDGIALHDHLRSTRPALARRLLFLTGDTIGEDTAAFLRRTGCTHLEKPVLIEDLLRTARKVLRQGSASGKVAGQGELFQGGARE